MFDRIQDFVVGYDSPSFEMALFSMLLAFVLSTFIAFVYRFTHDEAFFSNAFFQALVMSSMVSAMVMMAVGDNLAAGFGIIGAVAIVRFRTRMQNPRNIIFIFATLSIGIAAGVYGYAIAVAGTFIFSSVAILLYFTPYGSIRQQHFIVTIDAKTDVDAAYFQNQLKQITATTYLKEIRIDTEKARYIFVVTLNAQQTTDILMKGLQSLSCTSFRIEESDTILGL